MSDSPEEAPPTPLDIDAIDSGVASVEEKKSPDVRDHLEKEEVESAKLKNELARSQIKNVKADRKMRKKYASRILRYLEAYSACVGVMAVANGFHVWGFDLGQNAIALLVGSTAVSAIGLVGFVARGLFKTPA